MNAHGVRRKRSTGEPATNERWVRSPVTAYAIALEKTGFVGMKVGLHSENPNIPFNIR